MLVTQATKVPPGCPVNVPISVSAPLQATFGPMIWPEMWPLMFVLTRPEPLCTSLGLAYSRTLALCSSRKDEKDESCCEGKAVAAAQEQHRKIG
jgi:hypothetical protein